eukprot:gene46892-58488_t
MLVTFWSPPLAGGVQSDLRLRFWGMTLQLLGALTVWVDLTATARAFDKPGIIQSTIRWLRWFVLGQPHVIQGSAGIASASSMGCRIIQRRPIDPHAPADVRLSDLEYNQRAIDEDLSGAFNKINENHNDVISKIKDHERSVSQEISDTRAKISEGLTGNYGVLTFGLFWLGVGIVFASVAPEIAKAAFLEKLCEQPIIEKYRRRI